MKVLDLSYHPLDVRSGRWLDLSRKSNHGTPHGGARPYMIAPGVMGFEFDGNSGYVDCGDDPSLNITDEITIESWVNCVVEGKWDNLVGKGPRDNNLRWNLFWVPDNKIRFNLGDGDSAYYAWSDSALDIGKWYCIVGVYNRQHLRVFVNGVPQSIGDSFTGDIVSTAGYKLEIGQNGSYDFLNGLIGEVRIYNRALSADEIRENMYRSPIYRMLRGLPHSMIYTKVPWKQTQGGIYVP